MRCSPQKLKKAATASVSKVSTKLPPIDHVTTQTKPKPHTAQENPGLRYQGVVDFVASESMKPRKMATMIASLIALSPNLKFLDVMVKGPTLVSKNRKGMYCSRKVGPIGVGDGMGDGKGVGVGTGMSLLGL